MTTTPTTSIEPSREGKAANYLPFLDGLRGVAILLVMLFHFTMRVDLEIRTSDFVFETFTGFYLGVDIFFVVSGYLITRILLRAELTGRAYRSFFMRRAIRIFPPYWLYLVACLAVLPAFREYSARSYINDHYIWFLTYTNNFLIMRDGWPSSHLSHLWSLAVEEQFYILWPILFVVPILRRNWLAVLLLGCLFAPLLRMWMVLTNTGGLGVYVLLPARMDPLILGGLIAFCEARGHLDKINGVLKYLSVPAGLFIFIFLVSLGFGKSYIPRFLDIGLKHSAAAVLTGAVLTSCLLGRTTLNRYLTNTLLLRLGKLSYGLYLWHFMVDNLLLDKQLHPAFFVKGGMPQEVYILAYLVIASLISYLLALVSWKFFEEPILRLKGYFQYKSAKT